MFNRRNAETSQQPNDRAGEHEPERMETAEFTMSSTPDTEPAGSSTDAGAPAAGGRVFNREQIEQRHAEWEELQAQFIDDPKDTVKQADQMVAGTIDDIAEMLTQEREHLEQEWKQADDASTEDLRMSFQRYRAFLDRLLSM